MRILSLEAAKNSPHLPIKYFHTLIRLNIVVFIAFLMKMTIVTFISSIMDIVTLATSIQKLQFRVHQEPIPCIYSKVNFKIHMMSTAVSPYAQQYCSGQVLLKCNVCKVWVKKKWDNFTASNFIEYWL